MHSQGPPSVANVFLFLAGALLGFSVLGLIAQGPLGGARSIERREKRILAGMLDWAAVGAAVGVVALLAPIHGWVAWPLASFSATLVFLFVAGVQLAVIAATDRRRRERR